MGHEYFTSKYVASEVPRPVTWGKQIIFARWQHGLPSVHSELIYSQDHKLY